MFGTLQDRLRKGLKLAGIAEVEAAIRFIRAACLPAKMPASPSRQRPGESGFVTVRDPARYDGTDQVLADADLKVAA